MTIEQVIKVIQETANAAARWKLSWQQERRRNDELEASVRRLKETILIDCAREAGNGSRAAVPQA